MEEGNIIEVLDHRIKKVEKEFHRLLENFDHDTLHDYRVEMKKLKAFIRLLNMNRAPGKKIRIGRKMKDVYRISGNIRNLQLHQQRIPALASERNLDEPLSYLRLLDIDREADTDRLKAASKKVSLPHFGRSILEGEPFKLDSQDCKHYLLQKMNMLAIILSGVTYPDEALHEVRKILKDIGYNRNDLNGSLLQEFPPLISEKEQTSTMTEKLGSFHDLCVSLAFLQPYYTGLVEDKAEQAVLVDLKNILERNRQEMKAQVVQMLETATGSIV